MHATFVSARLPLPIVNFMMRNEKRTIKLIAHSCRNLKRIYSIHTHSFFLSFIRVFCSSTQKTQVIASTKFNSLFVFFCKLQEILRLSILIIINEYYISFSLSQICFEEDWRVALEMLKRVGRLRFIGSAYLGKNLLALFFKMPQLNKYMHI